jgi:hypothetical protein
VTPFQSESGDASEIPFELGVSGTRDADAGSNEEWTLLGADAGLDLSGFGLLAEYVASDNAVDGTEQDSFYTQVSRVLPSIAAAGYVRYDRLTISGGGTALTTDRLTAGARKDFFGSVILKLEYQRFLEDECGLTECPDHIAAQLVATF